MNLDIFGMGFNLLDIFVCIVLAIALIRGILVGFVRSISGLLGLVAGFWTAINYHQLLSQRLHYLIKDQTICFVTGFFLLFFVVYLFFVITGYLLRVFLKAMNLGLLDRGLGGILGAVKGLIVVAIVCFLLTMLLPTKSTFLSRSFFYPRLTILFRTMTTMVPSDLKANFMWRWRKFIGESQNVKKRISI